VGVDGEHVFAKSALDPIHRHVRLHQKLLGREVRGAEHRDADRGSHLDRLVPREDPVAADHRKKLFGELDRVFGSGAGEEQRKLVAAEARDDVGPANASLELTREAANELVARLMAAAVLDLRSRSTFARRV